MTSAADSECISGIELETLLIPWRLTCDAPKLGKTKVSILEAFKIVNSFRNRFAHVPFPYDRLRELADSLENCTLQLFLVQSPTSSENVALVGSLAFGGRTVRGSCFGKRLSQKIDGEHFVWGSDQGQGIEAWDARPFLHFDQMMRPYLLTRLLDQAGLWEYTRYLAEAGAVKTLNAPEMTALLPRPSVEDYKASRTEAAGSPAPCEARIEAGQQLRSREDALAAFRSGNYEAAINFWKEELRHHRDYHSGWHRLGMAQREWAARLAEEDEKRACLLLADSIDSFHEAAKHREPQFAAEALYNRSKAQWRLWKLTEEERSFVDSVDSVTDALKHFYAERYVSWMDFLEKETKGERTLDQLGQPLFVSGR